MEQQDVFVGGIGYKVENFCDSIIVAIPSVLQSKRKTSRKQDSQLGYLYFKTMLAHIAGSLSNF